MDLNLGTDSSDYHILRDAAAKMPVGKYMAVEIGIREGGSSSMIMQAIKQRDPKNELVFVGVDRYGGLAQQHSDTQSMVLDYTNSMRNRAIASLYQISEHLGVNFIFMNMDDDDFIAFHDINGGIPVFNNEKKEMYTEYAFVHFDGPHHVEMVLNETIAMEEFAVAGAVFVYDDIPLFDMTPTDKFLVSRGWSVLDKGHNKVSYTKG